MRKELDLNRDGKVDVVSYFDTEGQLEKEEMDSDYDGRFDWTDRYQDGIRVMSEYDTDYDGLPNVFKTEKNDTENHTQNYIKKTPILEIRQGPFNHQITTKKFQ